MAKGDAGDVRAPQVLCNFFWISPPVLKRNWEPKTVVLNVASDVTPCQQAPKCSAR